MITILEKGTGKTRAEKRNEKTYIKKCWNCKSKFTYQLEDLNMSYDLDCFVDCLNCGASNSILFKMRYKGK